MAARVSGDAASAFADGPPAGVAAAPDALKASAKPLNVVVIADTDLLSDFMWVQQRNFFGQTIAQPFANNGELVWNALDNLARQHRPHQHPRPRRRTRGPSIASRRCGATPTRSFRAKEQQLENELQQTEETAHQAADRAARRQRGASCRAEQAREIERFQEEKLRIRKELRATKAGLEHGHQGAGHADEAHQHAPRCR